MVKRALRAIRRFVCLRWLTGPILEKELRVASRKRRQYLLRLAYPLIFAAVLASVWAANAPGSDVSPAYMTAQLAEFGRTLALAIVIFQFIALHFLAVALLSTTLGDERRARTLGVLMTTPVTSLQIVAGKLASRLFQVLLFMGISTPFLILVRAFGGVPWEFVASATLVTLASVLSIASVTLLLSMLCRRMHTVVVGALLAYMGLFLLIPEMVLTLRGPGPFGAPRERAVLFSPPHALDRICRDLLNPGATAGFAWELHTGIVCGMSALVLGACVCLVRRAVRVQAIGAGAALGCGEPRDEAPAAAAEARIRRVRGPPVLWRELRQPFIRNARARRAAVVLALALVLTTYAVFSDDFYAGSAHAKTLAFFTILGLLSAAALAASAITSEREAGTWPALLGTLQTDARIVLGKFAGCLGQSLPVWALMAFHLFIFTAAGMINPAVPPLMAVVVAGAAFFVAAFGLWTSAVFRKTTTAVVATVLAASILWAGIPSLVGAIPSLVGGIAQFGTGGMAESFIAEISADISPPAQIVRVADEGCGLRWKGGALSAHDEIDVPAGAIVYTAVYHILLGLCFLWLAAQRIRRTPWARRRA